MEIPGQTGERFALKGSNDRGTSELGKFMVPIYLAGILLLFLAGCGGGSQAGSGGGSGGGSGSGSGTGLNFTISASPGMLSIGQGTNGTSTITTAISSGFDSSISLSTSGAPTGTTVSFSGGGNPTPGAGTIPAPGAGTSTMVITVGGTTQPGTYPITVAGNGDGIQQATTVTLTVTGEPLPFPASPKVYIDTTWNPPVGGMTWPVHNSGDFTAALAGFAPGDTIILDAGTVYSGNFVVPYKNNPGHLWTYIESSALNSLPAPGTRVGPGDGTNMPKIVTPNLNPALTLCGNTDSTCSAAGTNYIRLVGIELYSTSTVGGGGCTHQLCNDWSYELIRTDSPDNGTTTTLPDHITVDRCYLHGSPTQDVVHAIIGNGTYFAVVESYISDIHQGTTDSQAFLAYYTPGPLKIVDNYLSATTENLMLGGGGGYNNPYVPSDIEIRNNHFFKPLSWFSCGDGGTIQIGQYLADGTKCTGPEQNQWDVKNNLEVKSAQRAVITGNTMENNWLSGQTGTSVLFTVRTGQSGNIAVVDDILFQNNTITNVTSGMTTLEGDNVCGAGGGYPQCTTPGETRRIWVDNNLFLLRNSQDTVEHIGIQFSPSGMDLETPPKSYPGLTDFIYQHNTVLMSDNSTLYLSANFNIAEGTCSVPIPSETHNVWVLDNAVTRQIDGQCGFVAGYGITGLGYYMGDPSPVSPRFYGNVMFIAPGDSEHTYPPNNDTTSTPFTYVNPSGGDYKLSSPNWTDTTDGNIAGIN